MRRKNIMLLILFLFPLCSLYPDEYPPPSYSPLDTEETTPQQKGEDKHESLTISEILANGKYLILSDNSAWEIEPTFAPISQAWLTPAPVEIGKSDNPDYPYLIKNQLTQTNIEAKKASLLDIYKEMEKEEAIKKSHQLKPKEQEISPEENGAKSIHK